MERTRIRGTRRLAFSDSCSLRDGRAGVQDGAGCGGEDWVSGDEDRDDIKCGGRKNGGCRGDGRWGEGGREERSNGGGSAGWVIGRSSESSEVPDCGSVHRISDVQAWCSLRRTGHDRGRPGIVRSAGRWGVCEGLGDAFRDGGGARHV